METDLTKIRQAYDALRAGNVHNALTYLADFFAAIPHKTSEQLLGEAHDLIVKDYFEDVQDIAEEFARLWRAGDFDGDRDRAMTWLHESVSGSQRVIYTVKAQACLLASSNDSAGEELECKATDWSALAYCAMERDVLEALDIDVNEDPPREGERRCVECEELEVWTEPGSICDGCRAADDPADA